MEAHRMKARLGDRSLFPDLEAWSYLNHAAISPPSLPVRRAVTDVLDDYARRGVGAIGTWMQHHEEVRADLAALLGVGPADLGFITNTTQGVVAVAQCIPWRRGDGVVCFRGEFPTNVTPWQQAAATHDLRFQLIEPSLDALEDCLKQGQRLVAVSAVQFQTGRLMPLKQMADMCHAHGAELFVDSIQATGVVPMDLAALGLDYVAAGSHKWLMGLEGAGFLYVAPERIGALRPNVAGWLSHEEPLRFLFEGAGHLRYDRAIRAQASFVEGGVHNTLGLAAFGASIRLIAQLGIPTIFEHVTAWLDAIAPGLEARGFRALRSSDRSEQSGIGSYLPPEGVSAGALVTALSGKGVACTGPDGCFRLAPHWPNHIDEVPRVLDAIDEQLTPAT
ncbi:MAG: cysteine desulfurase/selenocysteine lyase [Myxococcota bacterium]|jgi:cysteine desulfurase/selenocysteine lyase